MRLRLPSPLRRFLDDRKGLAAMEFALIAPILLCLYFLTMEVSQGIETNRKVSRAASMVADLVAQQRGGNEFASEIDGIMAIGDAILQPYQRSRAHIIVEGIEISDQNNPTARVAWSRQLTNGAGSRPYPPNTQTTVPRELNVRGTFLIRVTANLSYRPVIAWTAEQKTALGLAAAFDNIAMGEQYFLRPRLSDRIACGNC